MIQLPIDQQEEGLLQILPVVHHTEGIEPAGQNCNGNDLVFAEIILELLGQMLAEVIDVGTLGDNGTGDLPQTHEPEITLANPTPNHRRLIEGNTFILTGGAQSRLDLGDDLLDIVLILSIHLLKKGPLR